MKKKTFLEKIGFSPQESLIYRSLLERGPSSISELMRSTGLYRPTIYATLPLLIDKGLVTSVPKGKTKRYAAQSPQKIEAVFRDLAAEFSNEMAVMEEEFKINQKKPVVTYTEGAKGITAAYSDVVHSLKKGDMYYRYSSASVLNREKYVPKDYREVRDKKGLERLVITNLASKNKHSNRLGREIKAVPSDFDLFNYDITQVIYGNKVAIMDYSTKTTITIENPMFAEFQKKIFKLLFKKL